jgi:hypothetical protein
VQNLQNILWWDIKTKDLQDEACLTIILRKISQTSLRLCLRRFHMQSTRNLIKLHLVVLQGLCIWMGKEWCLSTSVMGAKPLRESRLAQLMLIWSYQQRKGLLFDLRDQIPLHLRDRLSSRYSGCLCKPLHAATSARDAHTDSPASTVNDNAGCLNPSQYGG